MKFLNAIVLCLSLGLATCDFECFRRATVECNMKGILERKPEQPVDGREKICQDNLLITMCMRDAAVQCNTGFAGVAERVYVAVTNICTEGTETYNATKSDPKCSLETLTDIDACADEMKKEPKSEPFSDITEIMRAICRHIDGLKNCMYEKFEKCTVRTKEAFKYVVEQYAEVQKGICTILP
ncbi:uncharacterized protein [Parasteatoda tepidariorum]|uniref:uncharacterized protein isoform X1 n=1 Tax=Parasteatoda tepidariorum TaxID=114398 RepID=UPI001C71F431|nr:uncharacterized protein LOC107441710 isoform X2 [Parasteatoda tepidariorum]XP_042904799.1 uncharacterized protein LOC107441710 isoform X1 [Parasteatoda tepidariorum]